MCYWSNKPDADPSMCLSKKHAPIKLEYWLRPSQLGVATAAVLSCAGLIRSSISNISCRVEESTMLARLLNPNGFESITAFSFFWITWMISKEILSMSLFFFAKHITRFKSLDIKTNSIGKIGGALLLWKICRQASSGIIEFVVLNHIVSFLISQSVVRYLALFGFVNSVIGFLFALLVNDAMYYIYRFVIDRSGRCLSWLQSHHNQRIKFRGFIDTLNRHPLEQIFLGLMLLASFNIASAVIGLHAAAGWCALLGLHICDIMNHLPFDSPIHMPLPFPAYAQNHLMHRTGQRCNYGMLTSLFDRLFGTFVQYKSASTTKATDGGLEDRAEDFLGWDYRRPAALPSKWSFLSLGCGLSVAAVLVETVQLGEWPNGLHMQTLFPTIVILEFISVACRAPSEWISDKDWEERMKQKQKEDPHFLK